MGCCASRESPRNSSSRNPSVLDTSRAATPELTREDTILVGNAAGGSNNASGQDRMQRSRTRIRPPKAWRSTSRTWTRQQLAREREIFWETQVTGRPEVWAALKLAIEMVNGAGDQEQSDPEAAKAVVEAAGCTCPTGRLGEGVWDEQGRLYKLPRWIVSDPINVVEATTVQEEEDDIPDDDLEDDEETKESAQDLYGGAGEVDKGKDRLPSDADTITVTVRLSDRATDFTAILDRDQPVRALAKRARAEAGLAPNTRVKIAYMGRILKDHETLMTQGWKPGHVVNGLVFNS